MSLPQSPSPFAANFVLGSLSAPDLERLSPHLKPCLLHLGDTLVHQGAKIEHVYFAKTGMISLILTSKSGVDVEVGLIGREGSLGALEVLSGQTFSKRAMVQVAGNGWRIPAAAFGDEIDRNKDFRAGVLRAASFQTDQTEQCVLCNRLHSVEKRLARWLLMCQDRMHLETLELTHEFIANMLGTRRVGVTLAMGILREAGLINYSRGNVTICDRSALEKRACECYTTIQAGFEALKTAAERQSSASNLNQQS